MTANQVTLGRIILLPIPCAMLLFADTSWHWAAFFLFVILGMSDFVDGIMARREGPTKLGGLLDPVADKIMMAAVTLSLSGNGWVPMWIPVAILSREFFITALRSSVALRNESVKTSILAKMKTIIQMGGFGTVFLTLFLTKTQASIASALLMLFFVAIWSYWALVRKERSPYWALPVAGSFVYWLLLLQYTETSTTVLAICIVIVAITWLSAIDYLKTSFSLFTSKTLQSADLSRLFWVLSIGVFAIAVASLKPFLIIPILLSVSLELAVGGIDNIAVSEKSPLSNWHFWGTGIAACLFISIQTQPAAIFLLIFSLISCWIGARKVQWRFFPGL